MAECKVNPRAISMLVTLYQNLMADEDGELSLQCTGCGKHFAGNLITEMIGTIVATEQQRNRAVDDLEIERQKNKEWLELLGGYYLEDIDDKRRAELAALVSKWEAEDEEERLEDDEH